MSTTNTTEQAQVITFDQIRIGDHIRATQTFGPDEGGSRFIREGVVHSLRNGYAHAADCVALAWVPSQSETIVIERFGPSPRERAIEAMAIAFFGGRLDYTPYGRGEPDPALRNRRLARMAEAYDTLPQAARDAIEGGK